MYDYSLLADFPHQKGLVSDVVFSEDGVRLIVASENSVYEWELPSEAGASRLGSRIGPTAVP